MFAGRTTSKAVQIISPSPGSATQDRRANANYYPIQELGYTKSDKCASDGNGSRCNRCKVVFRDTVIVPYWPAGQTGGNSLGTQDRSTNGTGWGTGPYYDTAFPYNAAWTPSTQGVDTVFGIEAIMSNAPIAPR